MEVSNFIPRSLFNLYPLSIVDLMLIGGTNVVTDPVAKSTNPSMQLSAMQVLPPLIQSLDHSLLLQGVIITWHKMTLVHLRIWALIQVLILLGILCESPTCGNCSQADVEDLGGLSVPALTAIDGVTRSSLPTTSATVSSPQGTPVGT
jgi:hypothetical protein